MTVIEMVDKLRVNTLVEIRVNNFKVICVEKNNIRMVRDELLSKEVADWGVDNTGRLLSTMDKIFIDVKETEQLMNTTETIGYADNGGLMSAT